MVKKGEKGVPRSAETRLKIGVGARKTRLAERKQCPYEGCERWFNNGNLVTHIGKEHEFVCAIPECPSVKHKGLGLCIPHHRLHKLCLTYGTTIFQVYEDYVSQGRRCWICGDEKTFSGMGKGHAGRVLTIMVDHQHNSMRYRGLICNLCNSGLGYFKDDTVRLAKAIDYLRRHDERF